MRPVLVFKFRGLNPLRWGFGYWRAPRGRAVIELGPLDIYLPPK